MNKRSIGNEAEQQAKEYLLAKGYRYVCSNYQCKEGEIDLIFEDGETAVFVEVKFRSNNKYGAAIEAITKAKKFKLIKAAWHYLQNHSKLSKDWRIDVVAIQKSPTNQGYSITHIISGVEA